MDKPGTITFRCNICGDVCKSLMESLSREEVSCKHCGSTVRMRGMIHTLSIALFGKSIVLPEFPEDKKIIGKGMSDWEGYANRLSKKLGYTNTFYHKKPKLDIANISEDDAKSVDFIISTDVFEHVVPPISVAFENARKLLKPNGAFIFSVPYTIEGSTREHFPNLYDFALKKRGDKRLLVNKTREGVAEEFEDLVFHGGEGETLEMRVFSEKNLLQDLKDAGFGYVKIMKEPYFPYGIYWPHPGSLPILAREKPFEIHIEDWGPKYVKAGTSVNTQNGGQSALWMKIRGTYPTPALGIKIDGAITSGTVQKENVITALIPSHVTDNSGTYAVELFNTTSKESVVVGSLNVDT